MGARRKGRELALQALYQFEITGDSSERALAAFWEHVEGSAEACKFAAELVRGVLERQGEIDRLVGETAENWRTERLSRVDLNAIRVAVYELMAEPKPPVEVILNEAIEVVRKYGTAESAGFVNGVLDRVAERLGVKGPRVREATQNHG